MGASPEWIWQLEREGLQLLRGIHGGAQVKLWLVRSIELLDQETSFETAVTGLHSNPNLVVDRIERIGPWRVVWGRHDQKAFFIAAMPYDARCEALWLAGECDGEQLGALRTQLAVWLPGCASSPRRVRTVWGDERRFAARAPAQ